MKKILFLSAIFLFAVTMVSYSQQDSTHRKPALTPQQIQQRQQLFEKKQDSAISNRTIVRMKELFSVTADQEKALFQAGLTISNSRRGVFKSYWKTEAFPSQMVRMDSTADSLYTSIVGAQNYQVFKDALHSRILQRQQFMQQRVSAQVTDSAHVKQQ